MSVIFVVLPLAVVMAGVAMFAFVRSVRTGQYDDLETPPHRALFDDAEVRVKK
jgi:cbb3-type cytochrome oxidase maturation protein